MLLTCTRTELIKLRRSFIWLACFIIPILPSVMGTGNYLANLDVVGVGWYPLWTQATLFYGFFFFAPLISIYCAFLWRLENHRRSGRHTKMVYKKRRGLCFVYGERYGRITIFLGIR